MSWHQAGTCLVRRGSSVLLTATTLRRGRSLDDTAPSGMGLVMIQSGGDRDLAVLIPAWNERENLELLLPALRETLYGLGVRWEIIVADGGPRDGTAEAARQRGARVIQQQKPGYGAALMEAIAASQASYIVTMDADLSHRPTFIEDLWRHREEAEVLIASRYVPGGESQTHWFRRLCSRILNVT